MAAATMLGAAASGGAHPQAQSRPWAVFSLFGGADPYNACEGLWAGDADGRMHWLAATRRGNIIWPSISGDGRLIEFGIGGQKALDFHVYDTASGRVRKVHSAPVLLYFPQVSWTKDGKAFLYDRLRGTEHIDLRLFRLSDGSDRLVAPDAHLPALSNAGPLAYLSGALDRASLYTASSLAAHPRLRAEHVLAMPSWSAGGRSLAYVAGSGREEAASLWKLDLATGRRTLLQRHVSAAQGRPVHYAPRGSDYAFLDFPGKTNRGYYHGEADLAVSVDGKKRVLRKKVILLGWLLSGELAYARPTLVAREGAYTIRLMQRDGSGDRAMALFDEEDVNIGSLPSFSSGPLPARATGAFAPFADREAECEQTLTALVAAQR
jgi:hypothetical protein